MTLDQIPARTDGGFHVVVEAPRGSLVKLKYEPELGVIAVNRALPLGFAYPYDWGFVPGTEAPDGDPVDALVYWDAPSFPGVVVKCRALGLLQLEQDSAPKGGRRVRNDRILAIPLKYERGERLRSVDDLSPRARDELAHFFTSAVYFEPKNPKVLGWAGPDAALALLDGGRR
jgi:inorganic pyrophosphatase